MLLSAAVAAKVGIAAAIVTAATDGSTPGAWIPIGGYLTPAVVLVMIIHGDLATGRENKRLQRENDLKDALIATKDKQLLDLSASVIEKTTTAINGNTAILEKYQPNPQQRGRSGS